MSVSISRLVDELNQLTPAELEIYTMSAWGNFKFVTIDGKQVLMRVA